MKLHHASFSELKKTPEGPSSSPLTIGKYNHNEKALFLILYMHKKILLESLLVKSIDGKHSHFAQLGHAGSVGQSCIDFIFSLN